MSSFFILVYDNLNWNRKVLETSNVRAHWYWESNVITCVNFDAKEVVFFYEMSLLRTLVSKPTYKLGGVGSVGINGIWSLNPKDNLARVSIKWKTLVKFRT